MREDTVYIPAPMVNVIIDLVRRRETQEAKYGHVNDLLVDGTGPKVNWAMAMGPADWVEKRMREDYEEFEAEEGLPTWMHLVREEVAEAFMEDDPARLEDELLDVAALCVSWIERLRKRTG
jgi:hypothetical protein